ncbi:MAG: DUF1998 domain-containing protein [Candidatus Accumulibacter sp.]|jgi:hypothetical protein|uniref:DUF1998 domain-containing protein n=1 Tax=Accumulibacter sp. TaxID=2053492 RepID=UPI001AC3FF38|nr:DUF1998 domain-containing protein [Accumulibacter sp.]MBN8439634.1 DUF1998 domain-containing protein [Accumulibacter sp.]
MSEPISVRFSHLLGFAGVGSIVRSKDWLYTVIDTSKWPQHTFLPYVERVRLSLELAQELHEPPQGKLGPKGHVQGATVPGIRFPSWMRCRKCGLMHWQWWNQMPSPNVRPRCTQCRTSLDQFPWVMIDTDGRMDDVPWHWLLHHNGPCKEDRGNPHLYLIDNRSAVSSAPTSGAAARKSKRWTLNCSKKGCPACRDLDEKEAAYDNPRFFRHQPWRWDNPGKEGSEARVLIVDVSNPGLYAVPHCSALVIPPESRVTRGSVLDRLYCNRSVLVPILDAKNPGPLIRQAKTNLNCERHEVDNAIAEIRKGFPLYGQVFTPGQLLEDEFKAIVTPFDPAEGEDFVTFHRSTAWLQLSTQYAEQRHLICLVSRLIEVKRLREVRVFRGFSRAGGEIVPPDIDGTADWLPAIDLFGEGLFCCLDEALLREWEQQPAFANRLEMLQRRYAQSGLTNHNELWLPGGCITPRFMLLHTLAHLLIRQIEASAGYPAASLKERLYCGPDMAGILIYVAVPDIVGSLGGLSELSQPERFLGLLAATLDKADWCSLDPVCSEHEGQGPHLLNFAACHGCALIPEPACLFGNELLDRSFVKGDAGLGIVGIAEHSRRHAE